MKSKIIFLALASLMFTSIPSFCQFNPSALSFKVTDISNDSSGSYIEKIFRIEINNSSTNKIIQSIEHKIESIWYKYFLEIDTNNLEDVNFDGYEDLILLAGQGAMGRNSYYTVYLFDSLRNNFQYCEALSNIYDPHINIEDKTIDEFIFNGGDPNYTLTTYEVINNSLVVKKIVNQHFDIIETSYYENGKLIHMEIETVKDK